LNCQARSSNKQLGNTDDDGEEIKDDSHSYKGKVLKNDYKKKKTSSKKANKKDDGKEKTNTEVAINANATPRQNISVFKTLPGLLKSTLKDDAQLY
jgi:hypothetical protein